MALKRFVIPDLGLQKVGFLFVFCLLMKVSQFLKCYDQKARALDNRERLVRSVVVCHRNILRM
jgi:hypothetical protein